MSRTSPRTVAEVEGFVNLLWAACDDSKVSAALERLLSMPDERRRGFVHGWVTDLLVTKAPRDFVQAIACLADNGVAEKAYEVIFKCKRGEQI
jgi:hypothetical protein